LHGVAATLLLRAGSAAWRGELPGGLQ